jgi:hypothetical protein
MITKVPLIDGEIGRTEWTDHSNTRQFQSGSLWFDRRSKVIAASKAKFVGYLKLTCFK